MLDEKLGPRGAGVENPAATVRRAHRGIAELEADVKAWIDAWNRDPKPFV
ncbi:hypothetical protein L3Q67_38195 [Saccharothrix sp. AJ9571]|nr:hypothetical protein L3Q67_38195 [Saccharothrix sp. AJ9571]